MKSKTVHTIIGAIIFIVIIVVWKLNSYYKQEKSATTETLIHQQTVNLKTSISSQISQLKNIISAYQGKIDESKINWVQLNPFFALAQVEISATGNYTIKNIFVKSGTLGESWSIDYIQKAFSYSRFSNKEIQAQLFQNTFGDKFLALLFSDEKIQNTRQAVALIGEANYFQKYFDTQRSGKNTNLLITHDDVVVGHTQSEYIATKSQETKINLNKYYFDKDEIRSSNLLIASYAPKLASNEFLAIPLFILIFIFGLAFLLIGILLYVLKPIENENRKAEIFKKVFDEIQSKPKGSTEFIVRSDSSSNSDSDSSARNQSFDIGQIAQQEEHWNSLQDQQQDIQKIVENEIVENKVTHVGVKKINMSEIIQMAIDSMSQKISSENIQIEKHFDSHNLYECDISRFQKAIENVIQNSIEAHAKKIIIKVYDKKYGSLSCTNIDICDNGKGVDASLFDKVWQPFYSTKDKLKHKGLGLSEALSVVRRYGADMSLVENDNRENGAVVRIEMKSEDRKKYQQEYSLSDSFTIDDSKSDIDIDSILKLDDEFEESSEKKDKTKYSDIEKEFTTTQFKIDDQIHILENPNITFNKTTKPVDQFKIKVRKPSKA